MQRIPLISVVTSKAPGLRRPERRTRTYSRLPGFSRIPPTRRTARRLTFLMIMTLLTGRTALGAGMTAGELVDLCGATGAEGQARCAGFIGGCMASAEILSEAGEKAASTLCIPKEESPEALAKVLSEHLSKEPEAREREACSQALSAWAARWPCSANCRETNECKISGFCSPRGGTCVAAQDSDCREAFVCNFSGACIAREGSCVVESAEDCKSSLACRNSGNCSLSEGRCIASAEDCKIHPICKNIGMCSAVQGLCVAQNDEDCRKSVACENTGACFASPPQCVAKDGRDCLASTACKDPRLGWCRLVQNKCVK